MQKVDTETGHVAARFHCFVFFVVFQIPINADSYNRVIRHLRRIPFTRKQILDVLKFVLVVPEPRPLRLRSVPGGGYRLL